MTTTELLFMAAWLLSFVASVFCWRKAIQALRRVKLYRAMLEWYDQHPNSDEIPPEVVERIKQSIQ